MDPVKSKKEPLASGPKVLVLSLKDSVLLIGHPITLESSRGFDMTWFDWGVEVIQKIDQKKFRIYAANIKSCHMAE